MKIVTATELKSNLGEYFDLSLKGEEIVVFRHGRPAVKLIPITKEELENYKLNSNLIAK